MTTSLDFESQTRFANKVSSFLYRKTGDAVEQMKKDLIGTPLPSITTLKDDSENGKEND